MEEAIQTLDCAKHTHVQEDRHEARTLWGAAVAVRAALLAPVGLVVSVFGLWRLRRARRRDESLPEFFDPEDL